VERVLQHDRALALVAAYGRPLTLAAVRQALDDARARLRGPGQAQAPSEAAVAAAAAALLDEWLAPTLRPAINATGVIIHTNLGRAPLSAAARAAVAAASAGYCTLEYDLEEGARGARSLHAERLLVQLTGAEAALVVNNNAAAVLLMLSALAAGREVVISRGQLVEIGGGFRVPDVMRQSGCRLVEVGTTNRTHLHDYEVAITGDTALLLAAHASNFKLVGFTAEPELSELAGLAARRGVLLVHDVGSGALLDTAAYGLAHEPTVQESLSAGAAVVAFSGDKLLGGPQAGILAGRREPIERCKRHPLARAVRADKMTLAALQATLGHYLKDEAPRAVPVWRMLAAPLDEIAARAGRWAAALGGEVVAGESTVGGGSLPGATLPTRLVALRAPGGDADALAARLRAGEPPVIARILDDALVLDPRTVSVEEEEILLASCRSVLGKA